MRKICPECNIPTYVEFLGVTQEHHENNYIFKCTNKEGHGNCEYFFKMQKRDSKLFMIKDEMLADILKQRIKCPKSHEHKNKHFEHEFTHIRSKGNKDRFYCNQHFSKKNNRYEFRYVHKTKATLKDVLEKIPTILYYMLSELLDEFNNNKRQKKELQHDLLNLYKVYPKAKKLKSSEIQYSDGEEMLTNSHYSLYDRINPIYLQQEVYDIHRDSELLLFALSCINIPQDSIARIFHTSQPTISRLIKNKYKDTSHEGIVTITLTQKDSRNRLWHHKVEVSNADFENPEETWKSIKKIISLNP